jgi:hypothetical protein
VFCPAPLTPAQAVAVGVAKEGFSSAHCGLLFNAMTQSRPRSSNGSSSSTGANSSGVGKREDDGVVSSSNGTSSAVIAGAAAAATTDAASDAANSKQRAQRQRLMRWVRRGLGELRLDVFAYRAAQQQERAK